MRILFIRHAESTANAEKRLQGHAEFDLSEAGRAQAEKLRLRFERDGLQPTHVYSSPQRRTAHTAEIVARDWSVPIVYWDELKEHDIGVFSGLTWTEISQRFPDVATRYQAARDWDIVDGAESLEARRLRAHRVVDTLFQRHANGDVVVLFTHGGILQHMVAALMGSPRTWGIDVRNTAVFEFSVDLERWSLDGATPLNTYHWRINRFNDDSHLAASTRS